MSHSALFKVVAGRHRASPSAHRDELSKVTDCASGEHWPRL